MKEAAAGSEQAAEAAPGRVRLLPRSGGAASPAVVCEHSSMSCTKLCVELVAGRRREPGRAVVGRWLGRVVKGWLKREEEGWVVEYEDEEVVVVVV